MGRKSYHMPWWGTVNGTGDWSKEETYKSISMDPFMSHRMTYKLYTVPWRAYLESGRKSTQEKDHQTLHKPWNQPWIVKGSVKYMKVESLAYNDLRESSKTHHGLWSTPHAVVKSRGGMCCMLVIVGLKENTVEPFMSHGVHHRLWRYFINHVEPVS